MPFFRYLLAIALLAFGAAALAGQVIAIVYTLEDGSTISFLLTASSFVLTIAAIFLIWHNYAFYTYSLSRFSNVDTFLPWRLAAKLLSTIKHYEKRQDIIIAIERPLKKQFKKELSKALQESADKLKKAVKAEAVEIALWDRSNNRYSASYVVGKPFAYPISDRFEGELVERHKDLAYLHDIIFAGEQFGTIRVMFPDNRAASIEDRELVSLYAQYCAVSLLNSDFTSELLRMKKSADESVKAKTGFLANLSHEIRGPLGIIINAADLLYEKLCGELTPKQLRTVDMVRKHGNHLIDLVNDVLDFAKAESGTLKPKQVSISVKNTLTDMSNFIRQQASAKHQKIIVHDLAEELYVLCDKRHIRQIMINLLTNAVKYTGDGGTISIKAARDPIDMIKISVEDTGVGIPESQRERVFNAFERVDDSYSMQQSGTGLGMPLTKKLCELNGGSINFESTKEKGSNFWILLPEASTQEQGKSKDEDKNIALDGNGKHMLIVAPAQPERSVFEDYLANIHFTVTSVNEVQETKDALSKQHFDLILIDDSINGDFGEDPVRFLRSQTQKSAIFFLSSKAFAFDIEEKLKGGVDRYITKPISLRELGGICCEWVRSNHNS